jgi:HK97 family phage portal protein
MLQRLFPALIRPAQPPATRHDIQEAAQVMVRGMSGMQSLRDLTNQVSRDWYSNLRTDFDFDDVTLAETYAAGLTAYACANVYATIVSSIPLVVKDSKGNRLEHSPIDSYIKKAHKYQWHVNTWLQITGKAYLRKRRNVYGYPSQVEALNGLDVLPIVRQANGVIEEYQVRGRNGIAFNDRVTPDQMIVFRNFHPLNDYDGISPYEVAMRRIQADQHLTNYAAGFFFNSARLDAVLTYEGSMLADGVKKFIKEFQDQFKGSKNSWRTGFLGGGKWDVKPLSYPPADLAMQELKDQLRSDICAAFQVNPVLIGIGSASDPLSAQSTYESVYRQFLEHVAIPQVRANCDELNEQWAACDFTLFGESIAIEPDLSAVMAATKTTQERSTTAVSNVSGHLWEVNEGREHLGFDPLPDVLNRNPDWVLNVYAAGLTKRNESRLMLGIEPLINDLGVATDPDGFIYDLDPTKKQPPTPPGFGGGFSFGAAPSNPPALPPGQPMQSRSMVRGSGPGFYAYLSLANDPALMALQAILKSQLQGITTVFSDPSDLHITLSSASLVGPDLAVQTTSVLPMPPTLNVTTKGLSTFEGSGDKVPIILLIDKSPALADYQQQVFNCMAEQGITLSEYSEPDKWIPHITLGYTDSSLGKLPQVDTQLNLTTCGLWCSRDSFEVLAPNFKSVAPVSQPGTATDNASLAELSKWQRRVSKRGAATRFNPDQLPPLYTNWAREHLAAGWNPTEVFRAAKSWVKTGVEPQPFGASPQDYRDYWHRFDELQTDIGQDWHEYMAHAGVEALARLEHDQTANVDHEFAKQHDVLVNRWIGSLQEPGPLLAILLGGMAAGNESLNKEQAINPASRGVSVSWTAASQEAYDFARNYAYDLIGGLDNTTRDGIRDRVSQFVQDGWTRDQLRQSLSDWLTPGETVSNRAKVIADTEAIRAYNEGAFNRWQSAGVKEATWETVNVGLNGAHKAPGDVCPICAPLHKVRSGISQGWTSPYNGQTYTSTAHPRCRCFRRPCVDSITAPDVTGMIVTPTTPQAAFSPRAFPDKGTNTAIEEWMNDHAGAWANRLPDRVKTALRNYKSVDYTKINAFLRGKAKGEHVEEDPVVSTSITELDQSFQNMQAPEDLTGYRGVRDWPAFHKGIINGEIGVGGEFEDPAYSSVSLNKRIAKDFATGREGVLIHVRIPKGTAISLPAAGETGRINDGESELILPRGTRFRIVAILSDPRDIPQIIEVEPIL